MDDGSIFCLSILVESFVADMKEEKKKKKNSNGLERKMPTGRGTYSMGNRGGGGGGGGGAERGDLSYSKGGDEINVLKVL